ncbi:MAG TPA: C2H2-type zinc finger protein [Gammaproteobacteria bacterium]|nr:C2H2-type zinc finger protein [Gammaproteobacteria bacterium]
MAQFECPVCGQGFEQRSRLERHLRTSHPPSRLGGQRSS